MDPGNSPAATTSVISGTRCTAFSTCARRSATASGTVGYGRLLLEVRDLVPRRQGHGAGIVDLLLQPRDLLAQTLEQFALGLEQPLLTLDERAELGQRRLHARW